MLSKYIITKKLTKSVNDYPDGKSQPHVKVVKDEIAAGKEEVNYINHYIPYIITKGDSKSYAARAFHPNQYKAKSNFDNFCPYFYRIRN